MKCVLLGGGTCQKGYNITIPFGAERCSELNRRVLTTIFNEGNQHYIIGGVSNSGSTVAGGVGILQSSGFIYYKDG